MRRDLPDHFQGSPTQRLRDLARLASRDVGHFRKTSRKEIRPSRCWRRLFGVGSGHFRSPHGLQGGSHPEPRGAGRKRFQRSPRLGDGQDPQREIPSHRRDHRGDFGQGDQISRNLRGIRGCQEGAHRKGRGEHRPLPQSSCLQGRDRRKPDQGRACLRRPLRADHPLFRTPLRGCHRSRYHRVPGRSRSRDDPQGPHGHEQHVGMGERPEGSLLSQDSMGSRFEHGGLPLPKELSRPVVLGKRIRQGSAR